MTDEQIVRTLAEFMGWLLVTETQNRQPLPPGKFGREPGSHHYRTWFATKLPDYLSSYDALAPVFVKMCHEGYEYPEVLPSYPHNFRDITGVFLWKPREHAEALATAILSTKGESHADHS